jgi:hypothetical protein
MNPGTGRRRVSRHFAGPGSTPPDCARKRSAVRPHGAGTRLIADRFFRGDAPSVPRKHKVTLSNRSFRSEVHEPINLLPGREAHPLPTRPLAKVRLSIYYPCHPARQDTDPGDGDWTSCRGDRAAAARMRYRGENGQGASRSGRRRFAGHERIHLDGCWTTESQAWTPACGTGTTQGIPAWRWCGYFSRENI